jgi:hypothetical protein
MKPHIFVRDHSEARRKERLAHRHLDLAAFRERFETPLRLCLVLDRQRKRYTFELRFAGAVAVGAQHRRIADPQV